MICPFCNYHDSKVIDSRAKNGGRVIRRRRECLNCRRRFTTREQVEEIVLLVIKSDGRREPFDRKKLKRGIQLACTKRPISASTIDEMATQIEGKLREQFSEEVESQEIGQLVMDYLRELDEVAYVRFASVYRKFQDKEEFLNELEELCGPSLKPSDKF